jgi:hypothetical protein
MPCYLVTGYVKKEKKKQHMAIFPLGGVVYLTIAGCIVCVNSDYINFNSLNLGC